MPREGSREREKEAKRGREGERDKGIKLIGILASRNKLFYFRVYIYRFDIFDLDPVFLLFPKILGKRINLSEHRASS